LPIPSLRDEIQGALERLQRLEKEAIALRNVLERMVEILSQPVAAYEVEGETVIITQGDIAAVRAQLTKPRSDEVIQVLTLARKLSGRRASLSPEERERLFWENVEAIRAEAIAQGTAIEDAAEAAVGD
jgi:hypothetical protein